jgi:hypothetical protein
MRTRPSPFLDARAIALAMSLATIPLVASATEVTDFATAKAQAVASGKTVLIDFSSPT